MRSEISITRRMSCSTSTMVMPRSRMRVISGVEFVRFLRVHAGRRFVEQQQPRLCRERARHFKPALVAIGQVGGLRVAFVGETEEVRAARLHSRACAFFGGFAERALQQRRAQRLPTSTDRSGSARRSSRFRAPSDAGNRRMFWNVRAMPFSVRRDGRVSSTGWPSNVIRPASAASTPVTRLKNVVLPAPFGPISAWMCAVRDLHAERRSARRSRRSAWSGRRSRGRCRFRHGAPSAQTTAAKRVAREQAVRTHDHHQHQDQAVERSAAWHSRNRGSRAGSRRRGSAG